ncbi:hypothetical protein PTTG_29112 [Puccinia triticina 1-1 BBBD Race 1]|uniref:Uncharacterized protein n=1 Tax=Puccinia triticina (isolate 1-1 / race 1 (BBBD)) TaxID=630390 RepID=A0A180G691_PUCT1|nr:hypothetical protein PTTG_29112 [Puccinia triticina 1-1 BBBD Race 1]
MSASSTVSGNRPLACQSLFEIEEETQVLVPEKQQYGLISTPSLFTCNEEDPMYCKVALRTNTSRDHVLIKGWMYKINAKALFLNEDSKVPVLNYLPERATKICLTENFAGNTVNDANFFGVGLVVSFQKDSREENPRHGPCLTAVVSHSDWDPNVVYLSPVGPAGIGSSGASASATSSPDRKRQVICFSSTSDPVEPVASSSTDRYIPDQAKAAPNGSMGQGTITSNPLDVEVPLNAIAGGKKRFKKN